MHSFPGIVDCGGRRSPRPRSTTISCRSPSEMIPSVLRRYRGRSLGHQYGPGSGRIWMDNIHCRGSESKLAYCRHNGWGRHNCGHNEDVSISCEQRQVRQHEPIWRDAIFIIDSWRDLCIHELLSLYALDLNAIYIAASAFRIPYHRCKTFLHC